MSLVIVILKIVGWFVAVIIAFDLLRTLQDIRTELRKMRFDREQTKVQ
jgi:hypothetical protein